MRRLLPALALLGALAAPAGAVAAPLDLRLTRAGDADARRGPIDAATGPQGVLFLESGLRVVARGAALELQATRRPDGTVAVERAVHGPAGLTWAPTALHARSMAHGLQDLLHLRLVRGGRTVLDRRLDLCPNAAVAFTPRGARKRRDFPAGCGYLLSRRVPWGIGRDSAVEAAAYGMLPLGRRLRPGRYRAALEVDPADALGQPDAGDRLRFTLRVRRAGRSGVAHTASARAAAARVAAASRAAAAGPPRRPAPVRPGDPGLPDLVPLPSAAVALRDGRLLFDAMVANLGPGPLVVRGPRRRGRLATQLFERHGRVVGGRRVGELEYAHGHPHRHWHFHDLARYRLRDARGRVVLRSEKIGFCFMNTHPVDVSYGDPATPATPDQTEGCGLRGRQRIDAGWGDLYALGYDGQALDVRGLPNGEYLIEIAVDAGRRLAQTTRDNDVAQRRILLTGPRGGRRVVVPPVEGVDTAALDDGTLMPF
jgi:hypothetical protein